jgi:hypothetical protein
MHVFSRSGSPRPAPARGLVVRHARPADDPQIGSLARRVGEVVPARPLAVAERAGRIVAVQSIPDGVLVTPYGAERSETLRALHRFADAAR